MKLSEAAKAGIKRLRRPVWRDPLAYVKIDIVEDGMLGPWFHLYDRATQQLLDEATPQDLLTTRDTSDDFVPYEGELDEADKSEMIGRNAELHNEHE